jgi:hypothetical protein
MGSLDDQRPSNPLAIIAVLEGRHVCFPLKLKPGLRRTHSSGWLCAGGLASRGRGAEGAPQPLGTALLRQLLCLPAAAVGQD